MGRGGTDSQGFDRERFEREHRRSGVIWNVLSGRYLEEIREKIEAGNLGAAGRMAYAITCDLDSAGIEPDDPIYKPIAAIVPLRDMEANAVAALDEAERVFNAARASS